MRIKLANGQEVEVSEQEAAKLAGEAAALHDELNKMILPTCTSPLQQIGVNLALAAIDYRIGELAATKAEEASALGLIDKNGEVNLAAAEYTILNGFQWPRMVGPFKFEKADAEKILAGIKEQIPQGGAK